MVAYLSSALLCFADLCGSLLFMACDTKLILSMSLNIGRVGSD